MVRPSDPLLKQASRSSGDPSRQRLLVGLLVGSLLLVVLVGISLSVGAAEVGIQTVLSALTSANSSTEQLILWTVRLPRSLIAVLVGASLAVAGTILQGLTRNPLAAPDILGINNGAAFAMVAMLSWFSTTTISNMLWLAFLGAGLAAAIVYGLSVMQRQEMSPLRLVVAGSALSYLLASLTTGLLILNQRTLDEIRFWLAGSVAGRDLHSFFQVLPFMLVGLIAAFAMGRPLTTLALGDDVATSLGIQTRWLKVAAILVVIVLAGSSVAIAGPIWFIGLVVPHLARFLVRVDYRWLLPYSAMLGAMLLLIADIAARIVIRPQELPVGVMTALMGAPFFVYLARWKVKG